MVETGSTLRTGSLSPVNSLRPLGTSTAQMPTFFWGHEGLTMTVLAAFMMGLSYAPFSRDEVSAPVTLERNRKFP